MVKLYPGVAQLVARMVRVHEAVGSTPATRTSMKNRWNCLQCLQFQRFFAVFNWLLETDRNGYEGMCEHSPEHSRLYFPALTMPK